MNDEHADDVEPEVTDDEAIEREVYPPVANDSGDDEAMADVGNPEYDADDGSNDTI